MKPIFLYNEIKFMLGHKEIMCTGSTPDAEVLWRILSVRQLGGLFAIDMAGVSVWLDLLDFQAVPSECPIGFPFSRWGRVDLLLSLPQVTCRFVF